MFYITAMLVLTQEGEEQGLDEHTETDDIPNADKLIVGGRTADLACKR